MEQRPLRLGDVVDDYCPRERRVTNHAIVAIVEDVIRQTRCSTCAAEHPFKGGREPRLRKRPGPPGFEDQPLADAGTVAPTAPADATASPMSAASGPDEPTSVGEPAEESADGAPADRGVDGWLAHRQLIRATLPRTDADPPTPRPIPEFTMHQRQSRGGRGFRHFGGGEANGNSANGNPNANGNGPGRHGSGHPGKHPGRRHRSHKRPR